MARKFTNYAAQQFQWAGPVKLFQIAPCSQPCPGSQPPAEIGSVTAPPPPFIFFNTFLESFLDFSQ